MSERNIKLIDCGYIQEINDNENITIDISNYLKNNCNKNIIRKTITGIYEIEKNDEIYHFLHWTCSIDNLNINEYIIREKYKKLSINIINKNIYEQFIKIDKDQNYIYIIFSSLDGIIGIIQLDIIQKNKFILKDSNKIISNLIIYQINYTLNSIEFYTNANDQYMMLLYCNNSNAQLYIYQILLPQVTKPILYQTLSLNNHWNIFNNILYNNSNSTYFFLHTLQISNNIICLCITKQFSIKFILNNHITTLSINQFLHHSNIMIIKDIFFSNFSYNHHIFIIACAIILNDDIYMIILLELEDILSNCKVNNLKLYHIDSLPIAIYLYENQIIYATNNNNIKLNNIYIDENYEILNVSENIYNNHNIQSLIHYSSHYWLSKLILSNFSNLTLIKSLNITTSQNITYSKLNGYIENFKNTLNQNQFIDTLYEFYQNLLQINSMLILSIEHAVILRFRDAYLLFLPNLGIKYYTQFDNNTLCSNIFDKYTNFANFDLYDIILTISLYSYDSIDNDIGDHYVSKILSQYMLTIPNSYISLYQHMFYHKLIEDISELVLIYIPSFPNPYIHDTFKINTIIESSTNPFSITLLHGIILQTAYNRTIGLVVSYVLLKLFSKAIEYKIIRRFKKNELSQTINIIVGLIKFYTFIIKLGLVYINDNNMSILYYIISQLEFNNNNLSNCHFSIISRLLYDPSIYYPLINSQLSQYYCMVYSDICSITKILQRYPNFWKFNQGVKFAFMYGKLCNDIYLKNYKDINYFHILIKYILKKSMQTCYFDSLLTFLYSISDHLTQISDRYIYDKLNYTLKEYIIKYHNDQKILDQIQFIKFDYYLQNSLYPSVLSIIFSFQNNDQYFTKSLHKYIHSLISTNQFYQLISTDYLDIEFILYQYIVSIRNSQNYLLITDIIIDFNLFRNRYRYAASFSFQAYVVVINQYILYPSQILLQSAYDYLIISYNALQFAHSKWQFISSEDFQHPEIAIFDFPPNPDISHLKVLIATLNSFILLSSTNNDYKLKINSYEELVENLVENYLYDSVVDLCSTSSSLSQYLIPAFVNIIDTCIIHENSGIVLLTCSNFYLRNSIISPNQQSQSTYDIWLWCQILFTNAALIQPKLYFHIAHHFLKCSHSIPTWITDKLILSQPNDLLLLYISYEFYQDACETLITVLNLSLDSNQYLSVHTITQVVNAVTNKIISLSTGLEFNENQTDLFIKLTNLKRILDEVIQKCKLSQFTRINKSIVHII